MQAAVRNSAQAVSCRSGGRLSQECSIGFSSTNEASLPLQAHQREIVPCLRLAARRLMASYGRTSLTLSGCNCNVLRTASFPTLSAYFESDDLVQVAEKNSGSCGITLPTLTSICERCSTQTYPPLSARDLKHLIACRSEGFIVVRNEAFGIFCTVARKVDRDFVLVPYLV